MTPEEMKKAAEKIGLDLVFVKPSENDDWLTEYYQRRMITDPDMFGDINDRNTND